MMHGPIHPGCFDKEAFPSKVAALQALRRMKQDKRRIKATSGYRIAPYRCHACSNWHIGRQA